MTLRRQKAICKMVARNNPFSTEQVESLPYCFRESDWPVQLERLRDFNFWAAIVGPQGSGKTTLLLELNRRLIEHPEPARTPRYYFVSREKDERGKQLEQMLASTDQGSLLLVDGMERFNWMQRRRLLNRTRFGGGLVAAVHHHSRLPTWIECRTDWNLMRHLLFQLVAEPDDELIQLAKTCFENRKGNIREVLRDLYDAHGQVPRIEKPC